MSNNIKNSIDKIIPPQGAEERMYKNIMCKAEAEKEIRKNNISIYRTAAAVAACFIFAVAAGIFALNRNDEIISIPEDSITTISTETEPNLTQTSPITDDEQGNDAGSSGGNPFSQTFTLEDINKWGLDFTVPEGAEDVTYHIFDNTLAIIRFTLNGSAFSYTVSTESGDNSGIYDETAETRNITDEGGTLEITRSGYYRAFWNGEKYYYCLGNTDGADVKTMLQTAELLIKQAQ